VYRLLGGQYLAVMLMPVDAIRQGDLKAVSDHVHTDIFTRQNCVDAGRGERVGFVDRYDLAMRMRTSYERRVQHSIYVDVVYKPRLAAEQIRVLESTRALSERLGGHGGPVRMRFAASSVAVMMF
jgi:hypothetical protein